jgi:hypothetical protein
MCRRDSQVLPVDALSLTRMAPRMRSMEPCFTVRALEFLLKCEVKTIGKVEHVAPTNVQQTAKSAAHRRKRDGVLSSMHMTSSGPIWVISGRKRKLAGISYQAPDSLVPGCTTRLQPFE